MTTKERETLQDIADRLRELLAAPEFGTTDQHNQLENITDDLALLLRD